MTEPILVALVAALAGVFGSLVTAFVAWRKWPTEQALSKADLAARLTDAAAEFIDDLRQQIKDQAERIHGLEENQKARNRVIEEQDKRIKQLVDDILWAQNQVHKLEIENKALKQRDRDLQMQIRKLRLIIQQAGLAENGKPMGPEDNDVPTD